MSEQNKFGIFNETKKEFVADDDGRLYASADAGELLRTIPLLQQTCGSDDLLRVRTLSGIETKSAPQPQ